MLDYFYEPLYIITTIAELLYHAAYHSNDARDDVNSVENKTGLSLLVQTCLFVLIQSQRETEDRRRRKL